MNKRLMMITSSNLSKAITQMPLLSVTEKDILHAIRDLTISWHTISVTITIRDFKNGELDFFRHFGLPYTKQDIYRSIKKLAKKKLIVIQKKGHQVTLALNVPRLLITLLDITDTHQKRYEWFDDLKDCAEYYNDLFDAHKAKIEKCQENEKGKNRRVLRNAQQNESAGLRERPRIKRSTQESLSETCKKRKRKASG